MLSKKLIVVERLFSSRGFVLLFLILPVYVVPFFCIVFTKISSGYASHSFSSSCKLFVAYAKWKVGS